MPSEKYRRFRRWIGDPCQSQWTYPRDLMVVLGPAGMVPSDDAPRTEPVEVLGGQMTDVKEMHSPVLSKDEGVCARQHAQRLPYMPEDEIQGR